MWIRQHGFESRTPPQSERPERIQTVFSGLAEWHLNGTNGPFRLYRKRKIFATTITGRVLARRCTSLYGTGLDSLRVFGNRRSRQSKLKCRPLAWLRVHPDVSAGSLHEVFAYDETKADPLDCRTRHRGFPPPEGLEKLLAIGRRDTYSLVGDAKKYMAPLESC